VKPSNTNIAPRTLKKQEASTLTCYFCGHTGTDVKPHDYRTLSGHDSVQDICIDYPACHERQLQKMAEIDKQIEIRQGSPEYLAECRRILAVEG
jgi:hypothetical protein